MEKLEPPFSTTDNDGATVSEHNVVISYSVT